MTVLGEDTTQLLAAMLSLAAGTFPSGPSAAAYQRAMLRAEAALLVQRAADLLVWDDEEEDFADQAAFDVFLMTYGALDASQRARFEQALRRAA